jgi:hypothetical protein
MFATDIVLKNETANLIESIRKFNENWQLFRYNMIKKEVFLWYLK